MLRLWTNNAGLMHFEKCQKDKWGLFSRGLRLSGEYICPRRGVFFCGNLFSFLTFLRGGGNVIFTISPRGFRNFPGNYLGMGGLFNFKLVYPTVFIYLIWQAQGMKTFSTTTVNRVYGADWKRFAWSIWPLFTTQMLAESTASDKLHTFPSPNATRIQWVWANLAVKCKQYCMK